VLGKMTRMPMVEPNIYRDREPPSPVVPPKP
jgi:hypothetical protein